MADYGGVGGGQSLRDALMQLMGQGQQSFPPASGADQPSAAVPIPPQQPPMQAPQGAMPPQPSMPPGPPGIPPQPDLQGAVPPGAVPPPVNAFARPRLAPGLDYAGQLGLQR